MKAILLESKGVKVGDAPALTVGSGEFLVRVKANALNRADLLIINGAAHGDIGKDGYTILGLEWAGEISEIGSEVTEFKVGDRVMGSGPSAMAEYLKPVRLAYKIPDSISYEQAATMPVALQTMHDAIITGAQFQKGQTIMFQGASSAVALMGMQIAKFFGASKIIGTAETPEKCELIKEYDADVSINNQDNDWVEQVLSATGGQGVDVLIDFLAGPFVNGGLRATKVGGHMINIGRMAGEHGDFDFDLHNMRRIHYIGLSSRKRTKEESNVVVAKAQKDLYPAMAAGALRMPISKTFPWTEAAAAFEEMAKNRHFGKIVLTH